MKKQLLLILLFSSFSLFAETLTIKLPIFAEGALEDPAHKIGRFYVYKLNGNFNEYSPEPKKHQKNETSEKFIESLFFAYRENDRSFFYTLLADDSHKALSERTKAEVTEEWNAVRNVKNPIIFYSYDYQGGTLISWGNKELAVKRLIYIKKANGTFLMHKLHVPKNELKFQNIGLYFNYRPQEVSKPHIASSFRLSDPHYNLTIHTEKAKKWVHLFRKEGHFWVPKVSVEDNVQGKYKFDDKNPTERIVEIRFLKSHFTKQKTHNLLILNTNFPVSNIPIKLYPQANFKVN